MFSSNAFQQYIHSVCKSLLNCASHKVTKKINISKIPFFNLTNTSFENCNNYFFCPSIVEFPSELKEVLLIISECIFSPKATLLSDS